MYGLSGNDYRVATLPKAFLIDIGIYHTKFKIDRTILTCSNEIDNCPVQTGWPTIIIEKASLLITYSLDASIKASVSFILRCLRTFL